MHDDGARPPEAIGDALDQGLERVLVFGDREVDVLHTDRLLSGRDVGDSEVAMFALLCQGDQNVGSEVLAKRREVAVRSFSV